jgi:cellulose synthase/poly-beta-1,6-N-acetylglucosamine synthase-like glycosyltransferase
VRTALEALAWALGVYFAFYLVGTLTLMLLAAMVTRRRRHELLPSTSRELMRLELAPRISVCVAAHDEAAVVVDTVRSLLALDYPALEIVLADDGSNDSTLAVLRTEFRLRPSERRPLGDLPHRPVLGVYEPEAPIPLLVLEKEWGGRSDTLNAAIVYARGPLVAVVDADEVVANDALARAVRPFLADPVRTIAAGAGLGIANGCRILRGRIVERDRPHRLLPLFQAIEYDRSFGIARLAAGSLRAMPLISGGFGVFRRDVLLAAGGYEPDTLGEDFDLTLRLHRLARERGLPYRIVHVAGVLCWTIVPETRRVLRRQRRRWHRGLQQVLSKHRRMTFRRRYGFLGLVGLPWALAYELFNPLVVVLAALTTALAVALGVIGWELLAVAGLAAWACAVAPTLAALLLTDSPAGTSTGWRNLAAVVGAALVDFAYQCLTLVYRLETLVRRRREVAWGEMERSLPD